MGGSAAALVSGDVGDDDKQLYTSLRGRRPGYSRTLQRKSNRNVTLH